MLQTLSPKDPVSIGRFRLLARIATGGMATVYLGLTAGGRPVAVKLVHRNLSRDRAARARFRREVAGLRSLGGSATAALIDADIQTARPWLATEYLPAVSLAEAVGGHGPLPAGAAWRLAAELTEALLRLHHAGILHLDLNPANVLLTADGPRVIDLGISESLPGSGFVVAGAPGTPGFAAPEQHNGGAVGPAADVYSLAATLAYTVTGAPPNPDPRWWQGLLRQRLGPVLVGCLDFDAAARPTVPELAARLEAAAGSEPPDTVPLPPPLLAEIDRRTRELTVPPVPKPAGGALSRRGLLAGLALTGLGVVALTGGDAGRPALREVRGVRGVAKQSREPKVKPRQLEFKVTGNTTLSTVEYTVDGETTTEKDVELPWETSIPIPPLPAEVDWRFEVRFPPGQINFRSLVDGYPSSHGTAGASGQDGHTVFDGTV